MKKSNKVISLEYLQNLVKKQEERKLKNLINLKIHFVKAVEDVRSLFLY